MSAPPAPERTVLLAGASGLVGGLALRQLLEGAGAAFFEAVVAVGRRPLELVHPRLRVMVTDFERLESSSPVPAAAALCALGTTIKRAGSQQAFRAVDRDAVVAFARWARQGGAATFGLVSSVGAAADAGTFYQRVKGEAEEAIRGLGFERVVFLQPSMLRGEREELRPAEALAQAVIPVINPLLVGPARRYRGIAAETVAGALVAAARPRQPGQQSQVAWQYDELVAAAEGAPVP